MALAVALPRTASRRAAVGARLLYPDSRLQHCGVVVGLGGAAGHPLVGLDEGRTRLSRRWPVRTREVAAVTGACLATRRDVFDRLGGFDETLGVDLNDIDYCLRAEAAGFRHRLRARVRSSSTTNRPAGARPVERR